MFRGCSPLIVESAALQALISLNWWSNMVCAVGHYTFVSRTQCTNSDSIPGGHYPHLKQVGGGAPVVLCYL